MKKTKKVAGLKDVTEVTDPWRNWGFLIGWEEKLKSLLCSKKVLFVGVGSTIRGDDGVGVFLAGLLKPYFPVFIAGERPENLLSRELRGVETVIFLDACSFGGKTGDIKLLKTEETENRFLYSHRVPLHLIASLLEGTEVYILGIEPCELMPGAGLSQRVKKSAYLVRDFIKSHCERQKGESS